MSSELDDLGEYRILGDVPITLRAELGQRTISFMELISMDVGSVMKLDRSTGENVDLLAGDVLIGSGEILVIDSTLAVRLAEFSEKPVEKRSVAKIPESE